MSVKKKIAITLLVNGEEHDLFVYPNHTLLEVLRNQLQLTGAKESCGQGSCGACTVLMEGLPVRSCLLLAAEVQGRQITTIEGLAKQGTLHPVQQSFIDHHAIQCGMCASGMILTAKALLDENAHPENGDIRKAISGNICRCTGYTKIVEAIADLSAKEQ